MTTAAMEIFYLGLPSFLIRSVSVDPRYFSYCTDDDLVQSAYHQGVRKFWMVLGSVVYHLQEGSNRQQKVDRDSDLPYQYFIDKWKVQYPLARDPAIWHPQLIPNHLWVSPQVWKK